MTGGDPTITVGIPTFNRSGLLRQSIESVQDQTNGNWQLVIGDNASTDDTSDVVASYADRRIKYARARENVGMIGNFNRLIGLAETEFVVLLPDDDRFYPDYLRSVVEVLQRYPQVGFVYTAFDEIDIDGRVRRPAAVGRADSPPLVEPGHAFLERSMTGNGVFFPTVAYRTRAVREARGMIETEEPFSDIPLYLRIARSWDIGYVDRPLVAFRVHDETVTTQRLVATGQDEAAVRSRLLTYGRIMLDKRISFLDAAGLPDSETRRFRALASLRFLADRAGLGAPWGETMAGFMRIVRQYPRIVSHPIALRFMAAHCGGRAVRRAAARFA
jgi:glycosyltransferase involved in cell wall biosynthesis